MRVPLLQEDQAAGSGKLAVKAAIKLPTGAAPGEFLFDVEFIHPLSDEAEVRQVETYIPGAVETYHRAFGSDSDGRRPLPWVPAMGSCRLTICPAGGGKRLYEGKATIRRVLLRVVSKACVLSVQVRLESIDPKDIPDLVWTLGKLVDYEIVSSRIQGAGSSAERDADGLPFGPDLVDCEPGDLVTIAGEKPGIVVSVAGGRVVIRRKLVDDPNALPDDVSAESIVTALRVCGPRGGPAADALARLSKAAPSCTPDDLIVAVLQAQTAGHTELLDGGWALTSTVLALAAALTDDADAADADLFEDPIEDLATAGDLPPEAGEDEASLDAEVEF